MSVMFYNAEDGNRGRQSEYSRVKREEMSENEEVMRWSWKWRRRMCLRRWLERTIPYSNYFMI